MPRMPHNNRMSTSASLRTNDIWSKAIGHDPYQDTEEQGPSGGQITSRLDEDKAKTLMDIAKAQNTEDRSGNDFVAKMYLGLKSGKKRRADLQADPSGLSEDVRKRLADDSSSSEDEFVEVEEEVKPELLRKNKPDRKKKANRKRDYDSDSSSSSSSDDSYERRKRRKKREKRKKRSSKKRNKSSKKGDCSESDSDSSGRKRYKRKHSSRREERKHTSR